jgi:predicted nucleic acid-binding protein
MPVVDASAWVALFREPDPHQGASVQCIRGALASGSTLSVPAVALAEVAGSVRRLTGRPEDGLRALGYLEDLAQVAPITNELARDAARLAAEAGLRGCDAV